MVKLYWQLKRHKFFCNRLLLANSANFIILTFVIVTHITTHIRLTTICPGLPGPAGTRKVKPI